MWLFGRDLNRELVVIAEIGVNHEGDVERASHLVRLAAGAGATAVKFQSYTPERYVSRSDRDRFERVTRFCLSEAAHRRLAAEAEALGLHFFSTAVTEDWIPLLAELGSAVKVASGDLTFEPIVRGAARSNRPMILSVGLGTLDEIDRAVGWVAQEIGSSPLAERLILLHCVVAYPTPIAEANVLSVPFLRERYHVHVGYSNHVVGPEACYAAVAHGAGVIEVNFTDRREGRTFRDHALSFEPAEMADLIAALHKVRAALGQAGRFRQPSELPNLSAARKGIVAARDLSAGTVLSTDDVMFARPEVEFSSLELGDLVGSRLCRSVGRGSPIPRGDVAAQG